MSVPAGTASRGGQRYVITLATASLPMPVKLVAGLAFAGLAPFRTRTVEDGRERFRLHLGYFASPADAEALLPRLRAHYPGALVAALPAVPSGSLDDTLNTAFSLLRAPIAALVPPPSPAGDPPTLSPDQVAGVMAPQRYAVQLDWSLRPIDPDRVPRLGIFRAYRLYAVRVHRHGGTEYGLRLGFFTSLDGARQVADYLRADYVCASVVPVSYREYSRASELAAGQRPAAAAPSTGEPRAVAVRAPTREEILRRLGAHSLEFDRGEEPRPTLTPEERAALLDRPPRGLRGR
ncbi:MAG: SPOR domain-containing protein [Proteobacteria bacterium]|nr:SPOR domain-containing protein [Pseudomonadota bacterium]